MHAGGRSQNVEEEVGRERGELLDGPEQRAHGVGARGVLLLAREVAAALLAVSEGAAAGATKKRLHF